MSVSSSEILCLDVGVKESPSFSISISWLVTNMLDKVITFGEGRPVVAWAVYYTSGISKMLHIILELSLSFIPHILKDSFDFIERLDTTCTEETLLSSCDIKFIYTNIRHDVFYKAIDYWIEKLINEIPLLRRFTKAFILEGLSIILEFNCFYINNYFYHQIKGTAMGTIFAVVESNLTVAYFEGKMFAI